MTRYGSKNADDGRIDCGWQIDERNDRRIIQSTAVE